MKLTNFLLVLKVLGRFFSWIRIRIFGRSGSELKKKSSIRIGKTPDSKHCTQVLTFDMVDVVDPPGVVDDLLPSQRQLVPHTVSKALGLGEAETQGMDFIVPYQR